MAALRLEGARVFSAVNLKIGKAKNAVVILICHLALGWFRAMETTRDPRALKLTTFANPRRNNCLDSQSRTHVLNETTFSCYCVGVRADGRRHARGVGKFAWSDPLLTVCIQRLLLLSISV